MRQTRSHHQRFEETGTRCLLAEEEEVARRSAAAEVGQLELRRLGHQPFGEVVGLTSKAAVNVSFLPAQHHPRAQGHRKEKKVGTGCLGDSRARHQALVDGHIACEDSWRGMREGGVLAGVLKAGGVGGRPRVGNCEDPLAQRKDRLSQRQVLPVDVETERAR